MNKKILLLQQVITQLNNFFRKRIRNSNYNFMNAKKKNNNNKNKPLNVIAVTHFFFFASLQKVIKLIIFLFQIILLQKKNHRLVKCRLMRACMESIHMKINELYTHSSFQEPAFSLLVIIFE